MRNYKTVCVLALSGGLVWFAYKFLWTVSSTGEDGRAQNAGPGRETASAQRTPNGKEASVNNQTEIETFSITQPMNEPHPLAKRYSLTGPLGHAIQSKLPPDVSYGIPGDNEDALKYISHPEIVFLQLLQFFGGLENHGTLYRDAYGGYLLRVYMLEVGIVDCAEVFLQLHPLEREEDELNGLSQEGKISEEDYGERIEALIERMQEIEKRMPAESYEEAQQLLWTYALKHGLDKMLSTPGSPPETSKQ